MSKNIRNFTLALIQFNRNASYTPKNRLKEKVAIVTASTEGIGFSIAKRLAKEGANVVISSRKDKNVAKALEELKNENLSVIGTVCHVAKENDRKNLIQTAVDKFGGIDILVSNAGTNLVMGPILECDEKIWDKTFEINVKSSFLLAKDCLPCLKLRGGGSIVFISSIGGMKPFNCLGVYSVTKTALLGLTKAVAVDLARENINVNCVAPGIIKTKFSTALHSEPGTSEAYISQIPMGRFGKPEDIAGVVAFLVSNDARYITGETIVCAGGMESRL